jgi:hypothetical protein
MHVFVSHGLAPLGLPQFALSAGLGAWLLCLQLRNWCIVIIIILLRLIYKVSALVTHPVITRNTSLSSHDNVPHT